MSSHGVARLIMLAGTSAGSGKSTVLRTLVARYRGLGRDVMVVDEDMVWGERRFDAAPVDFTTASPLFYELLHQARDAGCPAIRAEVVEVFTTLMTEALDRSALWLQDWYWPDLLGMLGWDEGAVRDTAQQLQRIGSAVSPRVIYLRVDPKEALGRALAERGPTWFNRYVGAPLHEPVTVSRVDEAAARKRAVESARIAALEGWDTSVVDGSPRQDDVTDAVWRELVGDNPATTV